MVLLAIPSFLGRRPMTAFLLAVAVSGACLWRAHDAFSDDTSPPTVTMTAPSQGDTVSGPITVSADADNVAFTTPGTYSVWVRGSAANGNDDSLHAGLDGAGPASADRLSSFTSSGWVWKRDTMDGVPATLVITAPGLHTIHLWMREDGLKVDKILLRTSASSSAPSGKGPSESPRVP